MNDTIVFYEELSLNAHPALKTQLYDGWILRFSDGYTKRANSVNPVYPSSIPFEQKVAMCEGIYIGQELPTVFKLTDASPAGLDAYLDAQGYEIIAPTYLFTNNTLPSPGRNSHCVTVFHDVDSAWREHCFRLNGVSDPRKIAAASAMMNNIPNDVMCAQVEIDGKVVACGLCVVERGYAGLYDIVVDADYRKQGYGFDLCWALLSESAKLGAKSAYLQVVAANAPAIALYKKLGYEYCYRYWYREKRR